MLLVRPLLMGPTVGPKTCQSIGGVKCKMVWCKGPKKKTLFLQKEHFRVPELCNALTLTLKGSGD